MGGEYNPAKHSQRPFAARHDERDNNSNFPSASLPMSSLLKVFGPIRLTLYLATLSLLPFAFLADNGAEAGWRATVSAVTPPLAVLMFFVLLLDALMNKLFAVDAHQGETTGPFGRRLWTSLGGAALILLAWGPFFLALLN